MSEQTESQKLSTAEQFSEENFTLPKEEEELLGVLTLAKVINTKNDEIRFPCDVKFGLNNLSEMDYKMFIYTLATMAAQFDNKGPLQIIEEIKIDSIPGGTDVDYFSADNILHDEPLTDSAEEVVLTDEQAAAEIENDVSADSLESEFADYSDTDEELSQEGTLDWSFNK